jgi:predicted transcriptional regulator
MATLQNVTARDFMSANLVSFSADMDVLTAIQLLLEKGWSAGPVFDRLGNLVGILSEKDCIQVALNAGYHGEWGGKVSQFMSTSVITVDADDSILDVARRFVGSPFKLYPVVGDNRVIGHITRSHVLRAIDSMRGKYPV